MDPHSKVPGAAQPAVTFDLPAHLLAVRPRRRTRTVHLRPAWLAVGG